MEYEKKAIFIILVTGRKLEEALLTMLTEANVHIINVIYGKGAVKEGFLMNLFGLVPEENKVVISCATTCAKTEDVLTRLVERFSFDKPNTGIAFTIPIEAVTY